MGGGVWAGKALDFPQATFWLGHQINTHVCTNLLSLVHTDKEVIYPGPKQTSHRAGTLLHKGCFANGELNEGATELLPGRRGESTMVSELEQRS